ncbi:glycosyltransferase family 39 protein [Pelotomaculum isophthalicicum JI]|uniref:Glycosyltransferase family 39 protein n=1 Tax=Pelotomaculum isophthalicicum JI TaxID=947010 RepID=A0A9X4H0E9_9FIRM|nr:glycosyltransferase family 39 protein [Pelotomaculum isophthalicicum]MDF9407170.1 glycosyltransferase family 39 protein [Pelotomaculum isophthalicicum JI]
MKVKTRKFQHLDIILIGTALLAAFLNIYKIWNDQNANAYYTAAVTSMLQSWHNFFYASLDPGGYVTVDKPPVTFWVQTLFAYIFGVHGWSVILPQALAGIGSVFLMYFLVKPTYGRTAARLASLIMACTPIAVAVSRTNNIDSLLVFTLLLATWMLFRGIREQKLSWLFGAFAMIGVGFNMKMLQAYMVVPAFYVFYLLAFKCEWKKKLAVLAAATVIMSVVTVSYAVVVDMVPEDNRPYVGGSQTNSVLELAFGYNGIARLRGMGRGGMGPGGAPPDQGQTRQGDITQERRQMRQDENDMPERQQMPQDGYNMPGGQQMQWDGNGTSDGQQMQQGGNNMSGQQQVPPDGNYMPGGFDPEGNGGPGQMPGGGGPPGQGGGGMFGTGQAGPLRLFQSELSGQASWLLPFVAFACAGLLAGMRLRKLTAKQNEALFWLAWLLPAMAFFSVAGFFHHYYLIMLAPPIAALAGAGWVELWNQYRGKEGWKRWLLPAGLLAATAFELYILQPYQKQIGAGWLTGIGVAGIGLALVLLLAAKKEKLAPIAAVAGMLVLLVAPLYWAATPLLYGDNYMMPQAGPSKQGFGQRQGMGGGGMNSSINTKLLDYVTRNNTGEAYLFMTPEASTAESYIIETGKAVVAMGGFSGSDPILTIEKLEQMVADKKVKYFLIPSSGSGGRGGSSEVMDWIRANSTEVPKEEWQSNAAQNGPQDGPQGGRPMGMGNNETLYEINI